MPKGKKIFASSNPKDRNELARASPNFRTESIQGLSDSFRRTALDQFSRLTEVIIELPGLADEEKVSLLYEALEDLLDVITSLSKSHPETAPELWVNRVDKDEDVFSFIRRNYGNYIHRGLKKVDLRHLDPTLYRAIYDWRKKNKKKEEIELLTKKQDNDRLLQQLEGSISLDAATSSMPFKLRELLRLYRTASSRRHRQSKADST